MLPFLKPKQMASTIIMNSKESRKEGEQPSELMSIAEKLIQHIHSKNAEGVAECLAKLQEKPDEQE